MAANINWANPVFDVKTSQNYLARLQEFLATQQPGGSNVTSSNGGNEHKRKNPSTADEVDTGAALKDRKHSVSTNADHATHSHAKEGSSERESPEADDKDGKPRTGKGSTSDKRKEQNRNAQRAFRDRKEKVLRDLEGQISELQRKNDTTVSENQNLKEMITRLQEENAKLRQTTSAPKSDFTFSVPALPAQTTAPAFSASVSPAVNKDSSTAPASYNNNDILSFLASSSAAPVRQPTQSPFQMINPSPPPATNNAHPSGMNSIDDFMMNWNSSAFGTELPQAVPPSVTNLTEQPANTDFASLWNSLNQGNAPAFSTPQIQQSQQQATADNNQFFSLFHNAFTPSLDGQAPASNSNPAFSQYVNSANTAPYNVQTSQNVVNNMFPFANANASSSASPSSGSTTGNTKPQPHHHNSLGQSSSADSPETCASSTSGGSDPSDAQPSTPNNVQALFASNNNKAAKSKSGDSGQSLYPDIGFTSFNHGNAQNNTSTGSFGNMFGNTGFESVTTPSGVFDMMNYRDPLLGNLDGTANIDNYNFGSFNPSSNNVSSSSATGTNNNKRSDTLDFSEFLVASPPSTTTSPPVTGNNFFQMPGNNAKESSSSSSLPTLGSLSNGPSPQSSINTASASSGASNISGNHNWLPYDIPYTHPLIQHVMKDQQEAQVAKQEFENQMSTLSGNNNPCDIDGLCADMKMKATCKDHARERIAQALQTDEQTIKLYNEYLASAGQNTQQTPSPNLS